MNTVLILQILYRVLELEEIMKLWAVVFSSFFVQLYKLLFSPFGLASDFALCLLQVLAGVLKPSLYIPESNSSSSFLFA